jgi:hypothetical protein
VRITSHCRHSRDFVEVKYPTIIDTSVCVHVPLFHYEIIWDIHSSNPSWIQDSLLKKFHDCPQSIHMNSITK